tara:strand:- start:4379 stop:5461 length:1083 start_codon:yes stop_codon:yes gene_type:complete
MRPTDIARLLGVSRVMVGRVLSNIAKEEYSETLIGIPGPETLRLILNAAAHAGVDRLEVESALDAVDSFDQLIRERFGTRGAMSAALSTGHTDERERFEHSSRYQAFKGMSSILGVESKVWLTSMMMTPNAESESSLDVTTIHGTTGLRQLRPNIPVHFVYGKPPEYLTGRQMPVRIELDPDLFLSNTPAPLSVSEENGQIINTFAPEVIGKDAVYDMFAGVHVPNGSGRFAKEGRNYRGTIVTPDVPVVTLVSDVILHSDIFEGIEPELFVHNTVSKGGADIEDPKRAIDRIPMTEEIVDLGYGLENIEIPEIPKYAQMIDYMCQRCGTRPSDFRVHRLQIQYPVYGFQYAIAFRVPLP